MKKRNFSTPEASENAFYTAIEEADLEAMMAVWEDTEAIICIHPLGPRLQGRSQIRMSWWNIFHSGTHLGFRIGGAQRFVLGDLAIHTVYEHITIRGSDEQPAQPVIATNIYRLTAIGWRMILHHASPGSLADDRPSGRSDRLH